MKLLMRWTPALLILIVAMAAFLPGPMDPVVIPSAFRWKNNRWLDGGEEQAVTRNGIQRVYHKLLDIDWNPANGAHPISTVRVPNQWRTYGGHDGYWSGKVELVPCIYITNQTFLTISDAEVDELAHNLLRKLRMECPPTIHGVMLDCDWSERTKNGFFRLVRVMNDSLDVPLTATIRLHQYARPGKTGVPPADRGMLMPYNVGKVTEAGNTNSIFDLATAEPYFRTSEPYPLPLDIGLPAFSWGVQFRNGVFQGILTEALVNSAMNEGLLIGRISGLLQVVSENNLLLPELHLGDEVRMERATPELLAQVAQLARKAVNSDTIAVVYFELGTSTFQRLDTLQVNAGYKAFGRLRVQATPMVNEEVEWEPASEQGVWFQVDSAAPTMPEPVIDMPVVDPKRKNRP